jgi:hypothetical protein
MKTLLWIVGLAGGWAALTLAINLPREWRIRKLAQSRCGSDAFDALRALLVEAAVGGAVAACIVPRLIAQSSGSHMPVGFVPSG